jgi:hypothetical protein
MITVPLDGSSDGDFLLDSNEYNVEEGQRETTIYTVTVKDLSGGVSIAVTVTFTVVGNAFESSSTSDTPISFQNWPRDWPRSWSFQLLPWIHRLRSLLTRPMKTTRYRTQLRI